MGLALHPGFHVVEDLLGVLGAGIVGRGDRDVGEARTHLPHGRAFAAVAVAARTEHDDQPPSPGRERADRLERALQRVRGVGVVAQHQDRKSTRLNSSHLVISYAVFCLKKKKDTHTRTSQTQRPSSSPSPHPCSSLISVGVPITPPCLLILLMHHSPPHCLVSALPNTPP